MNDYYDDEYDDEYDEYESMPRPSRRGSPLVIGVVAVFAVVAIGAASVLVWTSRQLNPTGGPGPTVAAVVIPKGSSFSQVSTILEGSNVVSSATVMNWYARFKGSAPIKAGRYVNFRQNSSVSDALKVLDAGPIPAKALVVRIIPGMWLSDALKAISKVYPAISVDTLQKTLASGSVRSRFHPDPKVSWEGYLLPETYEFGEAATPQQILQKIVGQFDLTVGKLGYSNAQAASGRSAADLVTIASMIERETGDPLTERPKIARVIFNRLDKGIPLGVDATFYYALGRKGDSKPLTKSELAADGPYNSRLRKGLPPTAISLPSKASLAAAIAPTPGPWIYYVLTSTNPRQHTFATTAKEFAVAKAECRKQGLC